MNYYQKCINNAKNLLKDDLSDVILHNCPTTLTYNELISSKPYETLKEIYNSVHHNGQLKLFLSEVQFLTEMIENINEEVYVVYAGSAPGNKNVYLSELFPSIKFIFIDPEEHFFKMGNENQYTNKTIMNKILYFSTSKFKTKFDFKRNIKPPHNINIYTNQQDVKNLNRYTFKGGIPPNIGEIILKYSRVYNIFVIEDFFTSELAIQLNYLKKKGKKVFFISDIRTVSGKADEGEDEGPGPTDGDILWNSAQMYNWIIRLKPDCYMLKFRCPFSYGSDINFLNEHPMKIDLDNCKKYIDFTDNYKNRKFIFIKGDFINLQAYPGKSSTETRLVGTAKFDASENYILEHIDYNIKEYEDKLFYYNRILRPYGWHDIPEVFLNKYYMVDRCGDCGIMSTILTKYVLKFLNLDDIHDVYHQAFLILEKVLNYLERYYLTSARDVHGYYYSKYFNLSSLEYHHETLCEKSFSVNIKLNLTSIMRSDADFINYYKKIRSFKKLTEGLGARSKCMNNILFNIRDDLFIPKENVVHTKNQNDITITVGDDKSKSFKVEGIEPNFKDFIFSRSFFELNKIEITDPYFYKLFVNFLSSLKITKIHLLLSNRCDILLKKNFYEENKNNIKIYTLLEGGVSILSKSTISDSEIIIVYIEELPYVQSYIRNYLIRSLTHSKIIFLTSSKKRVYDCNYIFTKEAYIHIEVYDPKRIIKPSMISIDSYDIDKDIRFWIKNVPYIFYFNHDKELLYDLSERYKAYGRIYLLPYHSSTDFLKNKDDIYFIEQLDNEECRIVKKYFAFIMKDKEIDYFYSDKIRMNGDFLGNIPIRTLEDAELYRKKMSVENLYNIYLDRKIQLSSILKIDDIPSILNQIEGFP